MKQALVHQEQGHVRYVTRGRPSKEAQEAKKALEAKLARKAKPATKDETPDDLASYLKARAAFVSRVERERATVLAVEEGWKYDRVIGTQGRGKGHTIFFVERLAGTIYGVKSDVAPNFSHWFDTVYAAKNWNWGGEGAQGEFWPVPKHPNMYQEVKTYGNYVQYEELEK